MEQSAAIHENKDDHNRNNPPQEQTQKQNAFQTPSTQR